MKYLIHTEGKIVNLQGKSYRVKAATKEEAQQLAREQFIEEYGCNGEIYTSKAIKTKVVTAGSIIGMLIAVLLSFINWKSEHATISIKPDLISTVMAIVIYSAYVIRFKGLQRMSDCTDWIFFILSVLLLSSFIQSILSSREFQIPIIRTYIDCRMLFVLAMILSWLGLKILSVGCMAFIVLCGFFKIISLNVAMGNIWGTVYAMGAAVGIILYLVIEPAIQEMLPYYHKCAQRTFMGMKDNIYEAGKEARLAGEKLTDYGKQTISTVKKQNCKKEISKTSDTNHQIQDSQK